jgi:methyltransferase (TIGR00027 family)
MDPRDTAAPIAAMRAKEQERPPAERLFTDPHAHLFAPKDSEVGGIWAHIPFFVEHVRLRTRFIDDGIRGALEGGTRLIVLVGAGFDTRGIRMTEIAEAGARVIEIDHGDQLAEKRRRLAEAGVWIPSHVTHVEADLSQEGELERALSDAGISGPARLHWVCEGLLGYLPIDAIRGLAEHTAKLSAEGSSLVANHFIPTWSSEALAGAFSSSAWRLALGPRFDELHRTLIGPVMPEGGELFAFLRASL